jgi:hypothetical protein
MPELYNSRSKRNRLIAIAAGAITVVAIALAFASGYLGQEWRWLRPAGEFWGRSGDRSDLPASYYSSPNSLD